MSMDQNNKLSMKNILFCIATFVSFATQAAHAATVVATKPSTSMVKIDVGTDAGVKMGDKVCISDLSGKKITCGKVSKENPAYSIVKVSKKKIDIIKKGMTANVENGSTATTPTTAPAPILTQERSRNKKASGAVSADHRSNFKFGYIYTAVSPNAYNKVFFQPGPEEEDGAYPTAWQTKPNSGVPVGGYMEFALGVGEKQWFDIGLRYRAHKVTGILTNYIDRAGYNSNYVSTSMNMTAFGLYFDYGFWRYSTPSNNFGFGISSGLDLDFAKIALKSKRENDAEVAKLDSSLSTASLRIGLVSDLVAVQPFGLVAGLNLIVPLAEFGKKSDATVAADPLTTEKVGDEKARNEDLIESLDHQKNSFAAEIFISTFISF